MLPVSGFQVEPWEAMTLLTCSVVRPGNFCLRRVINPETWGVAIEVPLMAT